MPNPRGDPKPKFIFESRPGRDASIAVGDTTTGDAGTAASVENTGTAQRAVLTFTVPRGAQGQTGEGLPAPFEAIPLTWPDELRFSFELTGNY